LKIKIEKEMRKKKEKISENNNVSEEISAKIKNNQIYFRQISGHSKI